MGVLLLFVCLLVLAAPCGLWDLSPRRGIEPRPSAMKAQSPNHWTAREFPNLWDIESWKPARPDIILVVFSVILD